MAKGARAKAKVHKKPAEKVNKKPAAKVNKKPAQKLNAPKAKPKAKQGPRAAAYEPGPDDELFHGYRCSNCLVMQGGTDTYTRAWEACLGCGQTICYECIKNCRLWFTGRCTHCADR